MHCSNRVPTQVLQSLIKSYIRFSVCKALQSLIFWYFCPRGRIKSYFGKKRKFQNWKSGFHIGNSKFSYLSLADILATESN